MVDLYVGPDPNIYGSTATNVAGANGVTLTAFQVNRRVTVSKAWMRITIQSGNIDCGIYSSTGTRLASSGTTACPAAANNATVNLTAPVTLDPGNLYYAAVASDNATVSMLGCPFTPGFTGTVSTWMGSIATQFPLPASLTLANLVNTKAWGVLFT